MERRDSARNSWQGSEVLETVAGLQALECEVAGQ